MKITIHQPEHMPWLGFFHKINMADTYVILDSVQFSKNYFQNRNKIRTANGWCWLTVPVKNKSGQRINEVRIDNSNKRWKKKYWDSIFYSYKKARFFNEYSKDIKTILERDYSYISELNIELIKKILEFLNININVIKSSDLKVKGKSTELLLKICQGLGADTYVSGISGKEYLNTDSFKNNGINVVFQEFHHPIYKQLHEPFMTDMSIIDALFCRGNLDIIEAYKL